MSDDAQQAEPLGTAEELGIAVFEGIDPSEVTIYEDGTHEGPPRWKETEKQFMGAAGMNHYFMAMHCPCGHFIRRVTYTDRPEHRRVRCEGPTMSVDRLADELGIETEAETEQTTLVATTDGGNNRSVDTEADQEGSL